jgi:prepilin-type N-terminal cleavage/methylation domain-containing protein
MKLFLSKSFTLIELLVVIAIIGILASILMPSLSMAREKARIAVEISNRKQIYTATVMYADENNQYLPYRGSSVNWLHTLKQNAPYDLNKILVDKYLDPEVKVRTNIMFCDSSLLTVRAPGVFSGYDDLYCTLSYYLLPTNGNVWETGFDNSTLAQADPANAIWSCMMLKKPSESTWLGHNAPSTEKKFDGASSVFMDGSAKWAKAPTCTLLWTGGGGFEFYRPVR